MDGVERHGGSRSRTWKGRRQERLRFLTWATGQIEASFNKIENTARSNFMGESKNTVLDPLDFTGVGVI